MNEIVNITKALADENRLRALIALRNNELCVCQIIEFLGLAGSTVSKHMSILKQAGLVETRKEGRWIYYSLAGRKASASVRDALKWLLKYFDEDRMSPADRKRLQKVYKANPEVLCRIQRTS